MKPNENKPAVEETQEHSAILLHQESAYSGPIPPPAHIEHYERVLSGSANRIIRMAEEEQLHRMGQDNKNSQLNLIGLLLGAFIVLVLIGVAVYAITLGATAVATVVLGLIIGLAIIFVLRQKP